MILFLPFLILFSSFANDNNLDKMELGSRFHFGVGLDLFQSQYKPQRYEFDNRSAFKNPIDNAISRVAWNASYRITENAPFYVGIRTNRGINFGIAENAYDTIAKQKVLINIKSEADSLYFATAVHKKILPFVIATKIHSNTTITYSNNAIFTSQNASTMYGFGIATPLGNKGTASFTYYLPNAKFNTKRMFGLSVNYFLI